MLKRNLLMVLLILSLTLGMGCASHYRHTRGPHDYVWDGNLISVSYHLTDKLEAHLNHPISKQESIIVASFVNINNLSESSTFGRVIAEHIASRFAQKGYKIQELKLRQGSIFVQEGKGEFLLSRDLRNISKNYNASAVIVGTYAVAQSLDRIYLSARIVRPSDSIVISSYDVAILMKGDEITIMMSAFR